MKAIVLAWLVAGCVDSTDQGGPWQDISGITGVFAPETGPAPAPRDPPACALRVATWNLHTGPDPADLAAQILASRELVSADVLLTQEIEAHPTETGSRSQRLAGALGMTWIYAPARIEGDGTHGIAIFSRFPLEAAAVRQLPFVDRPIHPSHRIALAADVVIGTERIRVVDVHLETRLSAGDRIRQLHPAINDAGEQLILGGNFNSQPWAWVDGVVPVTSTEAVVGQDHAQIIDDYLGQNAFAGAVSPDATTMRIPLFSMRLDNLYARGNPILAAGVEHVDGSDHWPVWFDVATGRCPTRTR
ncbi:MAG: endonuclease/exonuclease/phosphatase [Myxococcales bacterium]|nr:endonuclease/exonuclease/phosphatase [Myxococcales bacterium]